MNPVFQQKYAGVARLYGRVALEKIQKSHIAIIGLGGVGSWAAEALVRTGISQLTLIDLDDICITNTNRQIHTLTSTIGQPKIQAMKARLEDINPRSKINAINEFITPENCAEYLHNRFDYLIDAIDEVPTKCAIIIHCKRNKIPLICCGGAGGQTDPNQIRIADLTRTYNDPLLAKVRSQLRYRHGYTRNPKRRFSVPCVYSQEALTYPQKDGTVGQQKSNQFTPGLDCGGGLGATTMVTATFGFTAASYAIARICR